MAGPKCHGLCGFCVPTSHKIGRLAKTYLFLSALYTKDNWNKHFQKIHNLSLNLTNKKHSPSLNPTFMKATETAVDWILDNLKDCC